MKRTQRINRITRRRPPRKSKFWPIVLVIAALGLMLQLVFVGAVATVSAVGAASYYNTVSAEGLTKLAHTTRPQDIQPTRILDRHGRLLHDVALHAGEHRRQRRQFLLPQPGGRP